MGRRHWATVQHCVLELAVPAERISALSRAVTHLAEAGAVTHPAGWDARASLAGRAAEGDGPQAALF